MFQQRNPATGETGDSFAELDAAALEARIARASAAFDTWRTTPLAERAELLRAIADRFEANRDRLAATTTFEMGKTLASAKVEVDKCIAGFRHYADEGPAMLAERRIDLGDGKQAAARWLPLGPVLAIMPWNFPYWQVVRFMAPTLLAGNVGLLKHASNVPGTAQAIEDMVREAGGAEGLFQNLHIKSSAVGAIIDDPRVAAVTLTGSEGAGIQVAERAGRNLKKVVLELGGSDPFIVMPSADIAQAAKVAVTARIQNAGQSCICAKRMIVHRDVYDAFREHFLAGMAAVKVGDPTADGIDMGPLSSEQGRADIRDQVERAKAAGAKVATVGTAPDGPGWFYPPTVLEDVPLDEEIAREEFFGPVAMLFRADDIDDAIRIANDVPFGLGSSIWTTDMAEQDRLTRDLEVGMVAVNAMLASDPKAPFGGVKRSGHGRELSSHGLHEFMNLKTVMLDQASPAATE